MSPTLSARISASENGAVRLIVAVLPLRDRAGRGVDDDAQAPERPAVVRDRHEETGGQAVQRADLAADERRLALEAHRADAERVDGAHDVRFELGQHGLGVHVVERPEQLRLGVRVSRRAVAADADADGAGAASLALGLPDGVQDALAHALQIAVGPAQVRQLDWHRVLRVAVLAPAAFQQQLHLDGLLLPLMEVNDGRTRAEVVSGVLAGDGIDRVRAQFASPGGLGHGQADLLGHPDFVGAAGYVDFERRHARVLANRAFVLGRLIDVDTDDLECPFGPRVGRLDVPRHLHGSSHVGGQIRRRLDDELEHAVEEFW